MQSAVAAREHQCSMIALIKLESVAQRFHMLHLLMTMLDFVG